MDDTDCAGASSRKDLRSAFENGSIQVYVQRCHPNSVIMSNAGEVDNVRDSVVEPDSRFKIVLDVATAVLDVRTTASCLS